MFAAFLTTIFFSISVICGHRSAKIIGGSSANFWRLVCATIFLSVWAFLIGTGLSGTSFPLLFLSGAIGIGVGDVALFQALPRLGPGLTMMLTRCLAPPFAALIEWLWLGTKLTPMQIVYGLVILLGIGIYLSPGKNPHLLRKAILPGILFSILAAFGDAIGVVISRKVYVTLQTIHASIDGGTAAFQRILGGLLVAGVCLVFAKWHTAKNPAPASSEDVPLPSRAKWRKAIPWILANSFAGQTLGVSCYQWALQSTPSGIVLPIVATTPLVAMPLTYFIEKEKITLHSVIGGIIAVANNFQPVLFAKRIGWTNYIDAQVPPRQPSVSPSPQGRGPG
jgi:drug/metabolite transporter (DMT)-like permease